MQARPISQIGNALLQSYQFNYIVKPLIRACALWMRVRLELFYSIFFVMHAKFAFSLLALATTHA